VANCTIIDLQVFTHIFVADVLVLVS
jgi:hypothetical protein